MQELTYNEAAIQAVAEEMRRDPKIFYMSTDAIAPLLREFGAQRVRATPITEAALTGMSIGAAGSGFRPIVDWRQVTFCFVAMDQIVNQAANTAVERARSGGGPSLIECKTYRWRAHTERRGQPDVRDPGEIEAWKRKDPIALLERQLRDQSELDDAGLRSIEGEIMAALEAAVTFAEASPFPLPEQATEDVFAA